MSSISNLGGRESLEIAVIIPSKNENVSVFCKNLTDPRGTSHFDQIFETSEYGVYYVICFVLKKSEHWV